MSGFDRLRRPHNAPSIAAADSLAREAARLLSSYLNFAHVPEAKMPVAGWVTLETVIPLALFDRLCCWGAAYEDIEQTDPRETDPDFERLDYA